MISYFFFQTLAVIVNLLVFLLLAVIIESFLGKFFTLLNIKHLIFWNRNQLFPIDFKFVISSFCTNILSIPLIIFVSKYITDCLGVVTLFAIFSMVLFQIFSTFRMFLLSDNEIMTSKYSNINEYQNEKALSVGAIIGLISTFILFSGRLSEIVCLMNI